MAKFPQVSDGKGTGDEAERSFSSNIPSSWKATTLAGGNDYGYDYHVLVEDQGQVFGGFKVQLKGKKNPEKSADGTHFFVPIKASTLRLYAAEPELVALVLCDLSVDTDPRNCPLYYVWIHNEGERLKIDTIPDDQLMATLHVPLKNVITRTTNVSDFVRLANEKSKIGAFFDRIIENNTFESDNFLRLGMAKQIIQNFSEATPLLMGVMAAPLNFIWPHPPEGTLPWHLVEADRSRRAGHKKTLEKHLNDAAVLLSSGTDQEFSEYWVMQGKFLLEESKPTEDYLSAFCKAKKRSPVPKYISAWAEAQLHANYSIDQSFDFSAILSELTADDPATLNIKARIFVAEGRSQEALALTSLLPEGENDATRALIYTATFSPQNAFDSSEKALLSGRLSSASQNLCLVLKARARFFLAAGIALPQSLLPSPTGSPALTADNVEALKSTWTDALAAFSALEAAGWPSSVEYLIDIFVATAMVFGRQKEILPRLRQAAAKNPHSTIVQNMVEIVAAQSGDFKTALFANESQAPTIDILLRRVMLLHEEGRHAQCVSLFEKNDGLAAQTSPIFPFSLQYASLSAIRILRRDLSQNWLSILNKTDRFSAYGCLSQYEIDIFDGKDSNSAKKEIIANYESLGKPLIIARHIFQICNPHLLEDAEMSARLFFDTKGRIIVNIEGALLLGRSLMTLKRWDDLLEFSQGPFRALHSGERLAVCEAIAFDNLEQGALAVAVALSHIDEDFPLRFDQQTYAEILFNNGYLDDSLRLSELALGQTPSGVARAAAAARVFETLYCINPQSPRLLDIAHEYDRFDFSPTEESSARCLDMFMKATQFQVLSVNDPSVIKFHQKILNFTLQYPHSSILKISSPPHSSPSTSAAPNF